MIEKLEYSLEIKENKFRTLLKYSPLAIELYDSSGLQEEVNSARQAFRQWREENPSTYTFGVYGENAQFGAMEINWDRFKEAKPEEYKRIRAEIERLDVTWDQAVNDWEIRKEICSNAGYWY